MLDTDILIEIRPVDAFAFADETPVFSFLGGRVTESRIPRDRDRDHAAIAQLNDQFSIRESDVSQNRRH